MSASDGQSPFQLHIGGTLHRDGWVVFNAQPGPVVDYVGDCVDLSRFADNSVDAIYISHVLEHLGHVDEMPRALSEMNRVLKLGGILYVAVPDFAMLAQLYFHPEAHFGIRFGVVNMLFGGQGDAFDFHKCAFDERLLREFLEKFGFGTIERVASFGLFADSSESHYVGVPISLNLTARKRRHVIVEQKTPPDEIPA